MNMQPNDANEIQEIEGEHKRVLDYLGAISEKDLSSKYPLLVALVKALNPWSREELFNLSEINIGRKHAQRLSKLASKTALRLVANSLKYMEMENSAVINKINSWNMTLFLILLIGMVITKLNKIDGNSIEEKIITVVPTVILIQSFVLFVVYVFQYNQALRMQNILHKYQYLVEMAEIIESESSCKTEND